MMTGVNMVHVPHRGSAPAHTDLIAGQGLVLGDEWLTKAVRQPLPNRRERMSFGPPAAKGTINRTGFLE
jgi:hypothetical protein